jgi:hypothetical protein
MKHSPSFGAVGLVSLLVLGCSNEDAPKAWNALSTCLAGSAATAELPQRVKALRQIQLANASVPASKDAWPARCSQHANELYAATSSSGEGAILKRKLQERLNCAEDKASCAIVNNETFISTTTELWEAAKGANLQTQPATGVTAPPAPTPVLLDVEGWKGLAKDPHGAVGPRAKSDGGALVLLRPVGEKGKPTVCDFAPGYASAKCSPTALPEVPLRTVEFARTGGGVQLAALTETGLVAYDAASGAQSEVRGTGAGITQDGLTVEGSNPGDLVAITMKAGKAGKPLPLPVKVPRNKPIVVGDQIVWLEQVEGGVEFIAKGSTGTALRDSATLKGAFNGPFHSCEGAGHLAVATWERNASQPGSKPTAGDGKTQFAVTLYQGGAWTKPAEITMPFERLAESELACTKNGASMVYVTRSAEVLQVTRVDCSADGCKESSTKLPNVDSKYWWAAAPMGDKTFLMWRGVLGETRLRVAPLAELEKTPDVLLFDTSDFGGPATPEATSLITDAGALFVFKGERPVALAIAPNGSAKVVPGQ